MANTKRVSVFIPNYYHDRLVEIAEERHLKMTDMVKQLLIAYVTQKDKARAEKQIMQKSQ